MKDATIGNWFTDRVGLGPRRSLAGLPAPRGAPLHTHEDWDELKKGHAVYNPDSHEWPTVRAVVSGDVVTFSIEVDYDVMTVSTRRRLSFVLLQTSRRRKRRRADRAASVRRGQAADASCPSAETLGRAAYYGADVLRRRGESLHAPDRLRAERLGDNNHLVLLVRNTRTSETSWLGVTSAGQQGITVIPKVPGNREVPPHRLDRPVPPLPGWSRDLPAHEDPASSYPLFLGGDMGSRLVEVWLVQKQLKKDRFVSAPTPLFDVQYLFLPPQ